VVMEQQLLVGKACTCSARRGTLVPAYGSSNELALAWRRWALNIIFTGHRGVETTLVGRMRSI
jgi:hypothetical protein